ncbi:MAG: hypothetical protein ACYC0C_13065 [Devosia sp.]
MSRSNSTAALERRIRRIAVRHGLHMLKAQKPDARIAQHGGYMLRDAESFKIAFGDHPYAYCANLDEIEAYLDQLDETPAGR